MTAGLIEARAGIRSISNRPYFIVEVHAARGRRWPETVPAASRATAAARLRVSNLSPQTIPS
jgi:hypothetical protein